MRRTAPGRPPRKRAAGASAAPHSPATAEDSLGIGAYRKLKDQIVRLELAPAELISEAMLEKRLQCGRAAVRFAIQRLQAERLVRVVPRGGTMVADLAIAEIAQAYQVRTSLEILAARLCAQHCSREDLARLEAALEQARRAQATDDLREFIARIHSFFDALHLAVQNDILGEFLRSVTAITERFEYFCVLELERAPATLGPHVDLLAAIEGRDASAVAASMAPIGRYRAVTIGELIGVTLRRGSR